MRPIYIGSIGGVLSAAVLALPLFFIMPSAYIQDWYTVPIPLGAVGYVLFGIIGIATGYSAARWNWASGIGSCLKSGTVAGVYMALIAWGFIGSGAAGVVGSAPMWEYGLRQAPEPEMLRILSEGILRIIWYTYGALFIFLTVGIGLSGTGSIFHYLQGTKTWGRSPRKLTAWLRETTAITLLLLLVPQILMIVGVFALLQQRVAQATHKFGFALSLPINGIMDIPVLTFLVILSIIILWFWHVSSSLWSKSSSLHNVSPWGCFEIVALLVPFGLIGILLLLQPEGLSSLLIGTAIVVILTLINAFRYRYGNRPQRIAPVELSPAWNDRLNYILVAGPVCSSILMVGLVAPALSMTLGLIPYIGVMTSGNDPTAPLMSTSIKSIMRIQLTSYVTFLLIVPLAAMPLILFYRRWGRKGKRLDMDARLLEQCHDVNAIASVHQKLGAGDLDGPTSALVRSFSRISQDVEAALQQESAYNQRLALTAVEDRADSLLRELARNGEAYAIRFEPIVTRWRHVIAEYIQSLAAEVEARQEIDSPYIIGIPLTERQELFVGRSDISARIEQLLLDRRRPPLLLYGQRRMGKTSLLNNLGRLLPTTIIPFFIDLQGPPSQASDHAGFLYNLARAMIISADRQRNVQLPPLTREILAVDPLTHFHEWLDQVELCLGESYALLMLDEFEALEGALLSGRFDATIVLGMLRNLIQHRPKFKVLLAGSHDLEEMQRWASYLINVQIIRLSYLKETETRRLIERPVEDFTLRYEPEAVQRVIQVTHNHPFLVQLLCAEIIALKNEQEPVVRRLARIDDVERAIPQALTSGSFFFGDIQRNQLNAPALALLRYIAAQGEGAIVPRAQLAGNRPDALDQALIDPLRREIVEYVDNGYRFQIELVRRWFIQKSFK